MTLYDAKNNNKMTAATNVKNRFIGGAENLEIIAKRLYNNDNLIKLLARNGSDVLEDKRPVTEEERLDVFKNNIITIPVLNKDIQLNNIIAIQIADIVPMKTGLNYNIAFDVLCNIDTWNLDGYIPRPYQIMNEIDEILTDTKVKSIGPATFLGATSLKINEKMLGYTMVFNIGEI